MGAALSITISSDDPPIASAAKPIIASAPRSPPTSHGRDFRLRASSSSLRSEFDVCRIGG